MSRTFHDFSVSILRNDTVVYSADMSAMQLPELIGAELRRMGYPTQGQGGASDYLMARLYQCAEHYGCNEYGSILGTILPTDVERDMGKSQTITYRFADGVDVRISMRLFSAQSKSSGKTHLTRLGVGGEFSLCGRKMKWFGSKEWGIKGNDFSNADMCSQCLKNL